MNKILKLYWQNCLEMERYLKAEPTLTSFRSIDPDGTASTKVNIVRYVAYVVCRMSYVLCRVSYVCVVCRTASTMFSRMSYVVRYVAYVVCRVSYVACRMFCVVCRMSFVVRYVAYVVCRLSYVVCFVSCVVLLQQRLVVYRMSWVVCITIYLLRCVSYCLYGGWSYVE